MINTIKLDIRKVDTVLHLRAKQRVIISFFEEEDVSKLESMMVNGIIFRQQKYGFIGLRLKINILGTHVLMVTSIITYKKGNKNKWDTNFIYFWGGWE